MIHKKVVSFFKKGCSRHTLTLIKKRLRYYKSNIAIVLSIIFLLIGFIWLLIAVIGGMRYPITDIYGWNLFIGMLILLIGLILLTFWR